MIKANTWLQSAIKTIKADAQRSAETHLIKVHLPCLDGIDIYLKDESTHPTGSLKHRLARSLFIHALQNKWIGPSTTIVESSSGSTAISEAYYARLLGLDFVAVVPKSTARNKIAQIEFLGGRVHFVDQADQIYAQARRLAKELKGHYMDQFTYAALASDWRGKDNIASAIYQQMKRERHPIPQWIVMSAGTGGTSATLGQFIKHCNHKTQLCVVDPEHSVFGEYYKTGNQHLLGKTFSKIEGIGRPRVEPSFKRALIDKMFMVEDKASIATIKWLENLLGRKVGPSTGTNFYGALTLASKMKAQGKTGSIVTVLCDSGERYLDTYYNHKWVEENIGDLSTYASKLSSFSSSGILA